jgi:hypothetical protein
MPHPSPLSQTVDTWTCQAMVASSHLVSLYRLLGDEQQAALALKALGPCEEQAQRLGLQVQAAELYAAFLASHPEEVAGEAGAWQWLVEAHAGLAAFHGLAVDAAGSARAPRGDQAATLKAFCHSLQGYRTAFPEEMANEGIHQALDAATARSAEAFAPDAEEVPERERVALRRELEDILREAFTQEALAGI